MKKRVCDFCGEEMDHNILYLGKRRATTLKIKDSVHGNLDVCADCHYKIEQICKNKDSFSRLVD